MVACPIWAFLLDSQMVSNEMQDPGPRKPLRPRLAIAGHRPLGLAYLRKTQLRKIPKQVAGTLLRQGFDSGPKSMPSGPRLRARQLCRYGEGFGYSFGYCMGNLPIFVISMGYI
ncbi:MAG: hypothetical protein ACI9IO_002180 [Cyanobium sp.]|jgi:hypothetical protein